MKKLIYFISTVLFAICIISCNGESSENTTEITNDSIVSDYSNPVFNDITDVIVYRDVLNKSYISDSIYRQMSDETLINIYTVLKNKGHNTSISKRDITDEYILNNNIYDNLPKNASDIEINDSNEISTNRIQTSINQRDTIINGKNVKIKTITEYYE